MTLRSNTFRKMLTQRQPQIGLWLAMASGYTAELCGSCRFDWYVIDCEHSPNTVTTVIAQLQALKGIECEPVTRIPVDDFAFLKQITDAGCRTVLAPMVETAEQAAKLVDALYYPPLGHRGVGSSLARASDFGAVNGYVTAANDEMCLIVQVETTKGVSNIAEIAAVEGVHGIFIGAADLAADMGYLGRPEAPEVRSAVRDARDAIERAGLPAGALTSNPELAKSYLATGFCFVAVGSDVGVLRTALSDLRREFRP